MNAHRSIRRVTPAHCRGWASAARRRRAFTVLEMLIVTVILAILAAMLVPRLTGNDMREFRLTCDRIGDMLTMYARRESLSQVPVGLSYDPERHRLMVLVYDRDPEYGGEPEWRFDNAIAPVRLPGFVDLLEARSDGVLIDIVTWPLASRPGHERPVIELMLQGPDEALAHFVLPTYAVAPRQYREDLPDPGHYVPIDLNAIGMSRRDW